MSSKAAVEGRHLERSADTWEGELAAPKIPFMVAFALPQGRVRKDVIEQGLAKLAAAGITVNTQAPHPRTLGHTCGRVLVGVPLKTHRDVEKVFSAWVDGRRSVPCRPPRPLIWGGVVAFPLLPAANLEHGMSYGLVDRATGKVDPLHLEIPGLALKAIRERTSFDAIARRDANDLIPREEFTADSRRGGAKRPRDGSSAEEEGVLQGARIDTLQADQIL
ncbi:hypothetical protein MNEG_13962 [Monoraphidium neglectum]|uniref:Uncharacterized protein n=1 Tax=Monoraphidium neglectum TaxID=145388 RepID=A0A0D2MFX2_9CHLO|nr:hypothetical protein MNEG_13962 [Monoraphidium neglectum]KIY94000.1 hypothetical protein MNEG_13962 [Monoraphidium neglectum]|eukprot:XP_013893020.1 hypothetical protein MNEG_13962 [Monoraphidium neglectum]